MGLLDRQVCQANPLIEARKHMNTSEMRLFVLGLQDVKPHIKDGALYDVEFRETRISSSELRELFSNNAADRGSFGSITNLKRHIKKAFDCIIEIKVGKRGFALYHIYQKMLYTDDGELIIQFDNCMKPYILDLLGKGYTKYSVRTVFSLTSAYGWRIMELLLEKQGYFQRGENKVYRKLTISELRQKLNVPDDKYVGRIDNLKSRVLEIPIKEINEKTIYHVWYEPYRDGGKIAGFTIWMEYKEGIHPDMETVETIEAEAVGSPSTPASHPVLLPADRDGLRALLTQEKFTAIQVNSLLKKWSPEDIRESYRIANEQAKAKHLKGRARTKYMKFCLEKNIAAERNQAAEIVQREQQAKAEKQQQEREMTEGFKRLGIMTANESRGTGLKTTGEILNGMRDVPESKSTVQEPAILKEATEESDVTPRELTSGQLEILRAIAKSGLSEEHLDGLARRYGYPSWKAMKKDREALRSL